MAKKGSVQRRRDRWCRITDGILLVLSVLAILGCVAEAIGNARVLSLGKDDIRTYTGGYEMETRRSTGRFRSTNYWFHLGNGDVLSVPASYLENGKDLEQWEGELTFRYPDDLRFRRKGYEVLSITGEDGSVFAEETQIRGRLRRGIGVYALVALCCMLVPVIWGAGVSAAEDSGLEAEASAGNEKWKKSVTAQKP